MYNSPFLTNISQDMRQKGYSLRTEKTYIKILKISLAKKKPIKDLENLSKNLFL